MSPELVRLVHRCLEKEAHARPSAADVVREALPSLDDTLAWPPPGLTRVALLGRRAVRWSSILLLSTGVLMLAHALQLPGTHSATGWWNAWRAGSVVIGDTVGPSSGAA
ncbi:MAG: hypothetical protein U5K74_02095 [Gemmatimonadaceae bacterium]|nr:hypothetical protein [Gemmatimonadaceae bacterium]